MKAAMALASTRSRSGVHSGISAGIAHSSIRFRRLSIARPDQRKPAACDFSSEPNFAPGRLHCKRRSSNRKCRPFNNVNRETSVSKRTAGGGRAIGWVLSIAVLLVAVSALAAVAVPLVVSTELVRDRLERDISQWTGQYVVLGTSPKLAFWPVPSITFNHVSIMSRQSSRSEPLAVAESVTADFSVISALTGTPPLQQFPPAGTGLHRRAGARRAPQLAERHGPRRQGGQDRRGERRRQRLEGQAAGSAGLSDGHDHHRQRHAAVHRQAG